MKSKARVTVITITYNDQAGIRKTIESVINQTHPADEYIIIDGSSTDGTKEIINEYRNRLTHFISEPDCGIYDAMNKGWIKAAPSNFIIYCNSSDYLEKDATLKFLNFIERSNDHIDICHGLLNFVKNNSVLYVQGRNSSLLDQKMIEHPATFVRKEVFESLHGFNKTYKCAADYDFMLRAKKKGFKFYFLPEIISNFDVSGVSSTSLAGPLESLKLRRGNNLISGREYALRSVNIRLTKLIKNLLT